MKRFALRTRTDQLDPVADHEEIARILTTQEFPWDINQALSFALFRTYGVPSIGRLLFRTGEFTERVQKRYDDTGLILDAVLEHGFGSAEGRSAIRRMNQMHGSYSISNDDMRYVLATFVVTPMRWIGQYGWRALTATEVEGWTNYYRALGKYMGIKEIPETYDAFDRFMDTYERLHFAFDSGARAVADSTLELLCTFPPNSYAPRFLIRQFAWSLMDDPLLDAFGYRHPHRLVRLVSRTALRLRGRVVRRMPARNTPKFARELPNIRSYPDGYQIDQLGTFPRTCPIQHGSALNPHPVAADR